MRRGGMIGVAGKLALADGLRRARGRLFDGCRERRSRQYARQSPPVQFDDAAAGGAAAGSSAPSIVDCPQIEVQDGTSAVRVYAGADQSNANLRYQFSLDNAARECQLADGQLNIKVGVAGRVLVGPAGAPSSFTVPVRVVIRRESDEQAGGFAALPRRRDNSVAAKRRRISPSSPILSACLSA